MTQEQDIVERLENDGSSWAQPLFNEAAQTIAALRAERDEAQKRIAWLRGRLEIFKRSDREGAAEFDAMETRAEAAEACIKELEADIKFEQSHRSSLKALADRLGGNWYDFCEMMGVQSDTNEAVAYNLKAIIQKLERERDQWKYRVKELETEFNEHNSMLATAIRERDEARKALEPFANAAEGWSSKVYLDTDVCCQGAFTVGDLRRARSASSNREGGEE